MAGAVRLSDYAGAAMIAIRREASSSFNAMGLGGFLRGGGAAKPLRLTPHDLREGDVEAGEAFAAARFQLAGETLEAENAAAIWSQPAPSRAFARSLHGFDWLPDLIAAPNGAELAREHADAWIELFGRWNSFSWDSDILAARIIAWLKAGDTLLADETGDGKKRLKSVLRQAHYLSRAAGLADDGAPRLRAAVALTLAGHCLDGQEAMSRAGLAMLEREIKRQILPDGGHVSRAPQAAAEALIDLVCVKETLAALDQPVSDPLRKAIDRLGPVVRFFRFADGGLASFHGGGEGDRDAIELALGHDSRPGRIFGFAPHSGYHRAHAGGATVILDAGEAARGALSAGAHASALAFEMDAAGGRLVVNCGWSDDQPPHWREAVRASAAHSTLTLEETSSARLLPPGWRRKLLGPRLATASGPVTARRNEEDMGVWLEGVQEGYRELYGLSHRRRVFLAADGGDLRGEDALFRPVEDGAPPNVEARYRFAIRFHLHPTVRASLSRDAMSALLVQPNGDGWRFRTDGGPVRLERSVYLAAGAPPQRATQIVVQGEAEPFGAGDRPPNRVRWAFQRLGRIGGAGGETPAEDSGQGSDRGSGQDSANGAAPPESAE